MPNYTRICAETFAASGIHLNIDVSVRDIGELVGAIQESIWLDHTLSHYPRGTIGMYVSDVRMRVLANGHIEGATICVSNAFFKEVPIVELFCGHDPVVANRLPGAMARTVGEAFLEWLDRLGKRAHERRGGAKYRKDKSTQKSPDDGCQGSSVSAR